MLLPTGPMLLVWQPDEWGPAGPNYSEWATSVAMKARSPSKRRAQAEQRAASPFIFTWLQRALMKSANKYTPALSHHSEESAEGHTLHLHQTKNKTKKMKGEGEIWVLTNINWIHWWRVEGGQWEKSEWEWMDHQQSCPSSCLVPERITAQLLPGNKSHRSRGHASLLGNNQINKSSHVWPLQCGDTESLRQTALQMKTLINEVKRLPLRQKPPLTIFHCFSLVRYRIGTTSPKLIILDKRRRVEIHFLGDAANTYIDLL